MPTRPLSGLHVVVTGASAGIGAELARELAGRGCRLTLAARRIELLEGVAEQCRRAGSPRVVAMRCDVTDRAQFAALVQRAREHAEIDVWVSNAGSGVRHHVLEATDEDMLALYRLHALGSLHAYQLVAPGWIERGHGGQFVDVCSVGGRVGYPYNAGYAAAKHAQSAIGDAARLELASRGITVTTVYPGATVSDFSSASADRTSGMAMAYVRSTRSAGGLLRRLVSQPQTTAHVARCIAAAIRSRRATVYPHRWGNLAAWLYVLAPAYVTARVARELDRKH